MFIILTGHLSIRAQTEENPFWFFVNYTGDSSVQVLMKPDYKILGRAADSSLHDSLFLVGEFSDWKIAEPFKMKRKDNFYELELHHLDLSKAYPVKIVLNGTEFFSPELNVIDKENKRYDGNISIPFAPNNPYYHLYLSAKNLEKAQRRYYTGLIITSVSTLISGISLFMAAPEKRNPLMIVGGAGAMVGVATSISGWAWIGRAGFEMRAFVNAFSVKFPIK